MSAPVEVALLPTTRLMPFEGATFTLLAPVVNETAPVDPSAEFPVDTSILPLGPVTAAEAILTEPDHCAPEAPLFRSKEPPVAELLFPLDNSTDPP